MVSIIDAVQDGNIRKWAIDTYLNNVALGTTYRGYVESTTNKALVLIYKIGDVHKIKIIPISVDKFQLWPREGVIKPFTVQDAEGNNITLHVTEKGGWSFSDTGWTILDTQTAYPLTEASGTNGIAEFHSQQENLAPHTHDLFCKKIYIGHLILYLRKYLNARPFQLSIERPYNFEN